MMRTWRYVGSSLFIDTNYFDLDKQGTSFKMLDIVVRLNFLSEDLEQVTGDFLSARKWY